MLYKRPVVMHGAALYVEGSCLARARRLALRGRSQTCLYHGAMLSVVGLDLPVHGDILYVVVLDLFGCTELCSSWVVF